MPRVGIQTVIAILLVLVICPAAARGQGAPPPPRMIGYASYMGGAEEDRIADMAIDPDGSIHLGGATASSDFPNASAPRQAQGLDIFLSKLNRDGVLVRSGFFAGSGNDRLTSFVRDSAGGYLFVGTTSSPDFPVPNSFDPTFEGLADALVARVLPDGRSLHYAGFLSDPFFSTPGGDSGLDVAVDAAGHGYFSAVSLARHNSPDYFGVHLDANGAKLSSGFGPGEQLLVDGNGTRWSAFGSGFFSFDTVRVTRYDGPTSQTVEFISDQPDALFALESDGTGGVWIVGWTEADDFTLVNPLQASRAGGTDCFVAHILSDLTIGFSTYFGGTGDDSCQDVVATPEGVYVTGTTSSTDFPLMNPLRGAYGGGPNDAFLLSLTPDGSALTFSTYYGGTGDDTASAIAAASDGTIFIAGSTMSEDLPVVRPMQGSEEGEWDGFIVGFFIDADQDELPDTWETAWGFDPSAADGEDGAAGDPDADGRSNCDELLAGTHPRGGVTRYLAEGVNSNFFGTRLALLNPSPDDPARALVRFLTADGRRIGHLMDVPPQARRTLRAGDVPGVEHAEFSVHVESEVPLVVDRTVEWDATGYGSHAETGLTGPADTWYIAEGATHSGFSLFYLVQNPNAVVAEVEITYLLGSGAPVVVPYPVLPNGRFTVWVNHQALTHPALANAEMSAVVRSTNGVPILVERAMYLDRPGQPFAAGHAAAAVSSLATHWFFAEGATGSYFDLFLLLGNPSAQDADVEVRYLLPSGATITKRYPVRAGSRRTIWVDHEDDLLRDTAVSMLVESLNGVALVAERTMWWPGPAAGTWQEAHSSAGATTSGTLWAVADGEVDPATGRDTYLLVANTSSTPGSVRVTLLFETGAPLVREFPLAGTSRFNIDIGVEFPGARGRRFGALLESLGPSPAEIVVERATYSNADGVTWAAGANALATRLR